MIFSILVMFATYSGCILLLRFVKYLVYHDHVNLGVYSIEFPLCLAIFLWDSRWSKLNFYPPKHVVHTLSRLLFLPYYQSWYFWISSPQFSIHSGNIIPLLFIHSFSSLKITIYICSPYLVSKTSPWYYHNLA